MPRNVRLAFSVKLGESAGDDQYLAVRLDHNGIHKIIGALAEVNAGINGAVGIQPGEPVPGHSVGLQ